MENLFSVVQIAEVAQDTVNDEEVLMSVVIIGGHDRMVCQYKKLCKQYKCKAKVFTQMSADLNKQIGSPDVIVLFTNTVSHKMVRCAVEEAGRCNAEIIRSHTSSQNALEEILCSVCSGCEGCAGCEKAKVRA